MLVGVDRGGRDCDERSRIEFKQLPGVRRFERDDVDDEIEAVGGRKSAVLVPVERDVVEAIVNRPLGLACERYVPVAGGEGMCDRGADIAGTAEDERATCYR